MCVGQRAREFVRWQQRDNRDAFYRILRNECLVNPCHIVLEVMMSQWSADFFILKLLDRIGVKPAINGIE